MWMPSFSANASRQPPAVGRKGQDELLAATNADGKALGGDERNLKSNHRGLARFLPPDETSGRAKRHCRDDGSDQTP